MSEPRIAVNSYIFWSDKHGWDYVDHNTAVFLSECDVDARNRYADFIIAKGLFDVFGQLDQTSPDAQELLHHCDEILKRESLEENPIQEADKKPQINNTSIYFLSCDGQDTKKYNFTGPVKVYNIKNKKKNSDMWKKLYMDIKNDTNDYKYVIHIGDQVYMDDANDYIISSNLEGIGSWIGL